MDDHPAPAGQPQAKEAFNHHCAPHTVALLDHGDLPDFLALHETVVASLPQNGGHFVKKRTLADLHAHLAGGHHAIAVYSAAGELIAQALLTFPDRAGASNLKGYPFGQKLPEDDCAVIQSLGVHPDHKKCGLVEKLFIAAQMVAGAYGRTHIVAKMDAANTRSYTAFNNGGYRQFGPEVSVEGEGYSSVFMVQKLTGGQKAFIPAPQNINGHKGMHP